MSQVINNTSYNKIKILHELCRISWFIRQHAERDAQESRDSQWHNELQELCKDLDKHIAIILELHKN